MFELFCVLPSPMKNVYKNEEAWNCYVHVSSRGPTKNPIRQTLEKAFHALRHETNLLILRLIFRILVGFYLYDEHNASFNYVTTPKCRRKSVTTQSAANVRKRKQWCKKKSKKIAKQQFTCCFARINFEYYKKCQTFRPLYPTMRN